MFGTDGAGNSICLPLSFLDSAVLPAEATAEGAYAAFEGGVGVGLSFSKKGVVRLMAPTAVCLLPQGAWECSGAPGALSPVVTLSSGEIASTWHDEDLRALVAGGRAAAEDAARRFSDRMSGRGSVLTNRGDEASLLADAKALCVAAWDAIGEPREWDVLLHCSAPGKRAEAFLAVATIGMRPRFDRMVLLPALNALLKDHGAKCGFSLRQYGNVGRASRRLGITISPPSAHERLEARLRIEEAVASCGRRRLFADALRRVLDLSERAP